MKKILLILINIFAIILFLTFVSASDVLVWQGQYYTGTKFNTGTYEFNFSVYDSLTGGDMCYSNTIILTTGNWGEWRTEQTGVSSSCNNVSKDYYLNININGTDQIPRRRLAIWNFLRKNVDEITSGKIQTPLVISDELDVIEPGLSHGKGIGIGTSEPLAYLHLVQTTNSTSDVGLMSDVYLNEITGSAIILRKARGTKENPLPIREGDTIGSIKMRGYGTTGFSLGGPETGNIRIIASENWTDLYQGEFIQFQTSAKNTNILEERLRINESGIKIKGNTTADYFIGDGRFLTNVPINESEIDPKWTANYSIFLTHVTWENAMNGTLLKTSDWNSTNTSYYLFSNPYGYYNSTTLPSGGTEVDPMWDSNSSNVARTGNCPSGQVVQNTTTSGVQCTFLSTNTSSYWNRTGTTLIPSTSGDNVNTTGMIKGNYYSNDGSQGVTNTTGYRVCTRLQGINCQSWCVLQVKNGIITGCS